jgi:hypothetical protein
MAAFEALIKFVPLRRRKPALNPLLPLHIHPKSDAISGKCTSAAGAK